MRLQLIHPLALFKARFFLFLTCASDFEYDISSKRSADKSCDSAKAVSFSRLPLTSMSFNLTSLLTLPPLSLYENILNYVIEIYYFFSPQRVEF